MRDRRIVEISYVLIRSVIVTAGAILIARWALPESGLHLASTTQHLLLVGTGIPGAAWAVWSLVRFEQLAAAEHPRRRYHAGHVHDRRRGSTALHAARVDSTRPTSGPAPEVASSKD